MKRNWSLSDDLDQDVLRALESVDTVDPELEAALSAITGSTLESDMKRFQIYDEACRDKTVPCLFSNSLIDAFNRVITLQGQMPPSPALTIPRSVKRGFEYRVISDSFNMGGFVAARSTASVFRMVLNHARTP